MSKGDRRGKNKKATEPPSRPKGRGDRAGEPAKRSITNRATPSREKAKHATAKPRGKVDQAANEVQSPPRIIGGTWRNRRLAYSGDVRTRPMKERLRESVFSLLGNDIVGVLAIDLFAGTGALAFESLSRGASSALFLEQHFPTANLIRDTARQLGAETQCHIEAVDAFYWTRRSSGDCALLQTERPWCVFCSPPYDFFHHREDELVNLMRFWFNKAPVQSMVVMECDIHYSPSRLKALLFGSEPENDDAQSDDAVAATNNNRDIGETDGGATELGWEWESRDYPPARIGIARRERPTGRV